MKPNQEKMSRVGRWVAFFVLPAVLAVQGGAGSPVFGGDKVYVGAEVCGECHEAEYEAFMTHSKKRDSFESVTVMRKGLTEAEYAGCLACHSTGYGDPGGFTDESATPHLRNLGCEACHGPGSLHVDSSDPEDIRGDLSVDDCRACHNPERVGAFRFKPLLFGGAH